MEHLDLDVEAGSIVALIGPSGCGKTTTLRMINRLVEPSAGTITIGEVDITSLEPTELRRGIGYVIQQVGLFPHRTIAQNIATVPKALGWERARIGERVDELVELVGLDPALLTRYPDELSGGQQQRVGVARALAADPPVLLMDEPFGAVDPIVRARLQDELLALQDKVRKTIVLVTHDIDEAVRIGDRVALLNTGGVLEQYASPDEMLAEPVAMIAAHPTRGVDVGAQAAIWDQLRDARKAGLATLLISADLEELIGLSDSLLVIYKGRVVARLDPARTTPEELGSYMTGARGEEDE